MLLNFRELEMDRDQQISKLKKSRNISLIVAVFISISAAARWIGWYETPGFSPWVSAGLALLLFASAAHTHSKISKVQ